MKLTLATILIALSLCLSAAAQQDILPLMDTNAAKEGYVVATGRFSGDLYPKNSEMEITCVKAQVPQVSNSSVGFCLLALGFNLDAVKGLVPENSNIVGVSTDFYDIVSWGGTRIIAELNRFRIGTCPETRQLVVDFPSNTVTLTSNVSITEKCAALEKTWTHKMEPVVIYTLQHAPFTSKADKGFNPLLVK